MRRPVLAALFLAASLAPGARAGHVTEPYVDLGALPPPTITGPEIVAGLESFVAGHPYRVTGTPVELLTALDLRAEMAGLGYEARIESVPVDGGEAAPLRVVTATKSGTSKPDEWIAYVAHYDSIPTTIYGAYDNGSGTNMLRYLARELADVPTNRSLVFIWYSGEEEGLLASMFHAQGLAARGQKIAAVLGFDMVGIAWPVGNPTNVNCLCMWYGSGDSEEFDPLLRHVNFEYLGYPEGPQMVRIRGFNARNSDEQSLDRQGFPTLRWAGMLAASNYPQYHRPLDTMDTIYSVAGGKSYFEQGTFNTFQSAYYTTLALDNHAPVAAADATADGLTINADASASTDEDGALSVFRWDFGDGTTAEGAEASHAYAAPGAYTITLTVEDNRWPQIASQTTVDLTVA